MAFAQSHRMALSLATMVLTGFGMMVTLASCNTVIQTIVEERMRGRVMRFYSMALLGTAPLGSLLAGALASRLGTPGVIALGGAACPAGDAGAFRAARPSG